MKYYLTQAGFNFLNEVKSTVEWEKEVRAKAEKKERRRQEWGAAHGMKMTRAQTARGQADKAEYPEDYPPHTTDPDSPEQVGQEAGIKAGDLRHKRLKRIASQTLIDKFARKIKRGVRKAEIAIRIPNTALEEDDDSRRRQQRPIPGRRSSEERYTPKGKSIPNQSKDYAGHEERMQAHLDRIAAKERLDRKMGRDADT